MARRERIRTNLDSVHRILDAATCRQAMALLRLTAAAERLSQASQHMDLVIRHSHRVKAISRSNWASRRKRASETSKPPNMHRTIREELIENIAAVLLRKHEWPEFGCALRLTWRPEFAKRVVREALEELDPRDYSGIGGFDDMAHQILLWFVARRNGRDAPTSR